MSSRWDHQEMLHILQGLNMADYIQMKYNNEVGEAIRTLTKPKFNYPTMSVAKKETDNDRNEIEGKPNEMEVFLWKEKAGKQKTSWRKHTKTLKKGISSGCWAVFPSTQGST